MSEEEFAQQHPPNDAFSKGSDALFEEEAEAWNTLLSVTLEIKESLRELNERLSLRVQGCL